MSHEEPVQEACPNPLADLGPRQPTRHSQVRSPYDAASWFRIPAADPPANLDLALSSVVRELARLQIQVEILQQQIDDLQSSDRDGARPESRLSVVGEIGESRHGA